MARYTSRNSTGHETRSGGGGGGQNGSVRITTLYASTDDNNRSRPPVVVQQRPVRTIQLTACNWRSVYAALRKCCFAFSISAAVFGITESSLLFSIYCTMLADPGRHFGGYRNGCEIYVQSFVTPSYTRNRLGLLVDSDALTFGDRDNVTVISTTAASTTTAHGDNTSATSDQLANTTSRLSGETETFETTDESSGNASGDEGTGSGQGSTYSNNGTETVNQTTATPEEQKLAIKTIQKEKTTAQPYSPVDAADGQTSTPLHEDDRNRTNNSSRLPEKRTFWVCMNWFCWPTRGSPNDFPADTKRTRARQTSTMATTTTLNVYNDNDRDDSEFNDSMQNNNKSSVARGQMPSTNRNDYSTPLECTISWHQPFAAKLGIIDSCIQIVACIMLIVYHFLPCFRQYDVRQPSWRQFLSLVLCLITFPLHAAFTMVFAVLDLSDKRLEHKPLLWMTITLILPGHAFFYFMLVVYYHKLKEHFVKVSAVRRQQLSATASGFPPHNMSVFSAPVTGAPGAITNAATNAGGRRCTQCRRGESRSFRRGREFHRRSSLPGAWRVTSDISPMRQSDTVAASISHRPRRPGHRPTHIISQTNDQLGEWRMLRTGVCGLTLNSDHFMQMPFPADHTRPQLNPPTYTDDPLPAYSIDTPPPRYSVARSTTDASERHDNSGASSLLGLLTSNQSGGHRSSSPASVDGNALTETRATPHVTFSEPQISRRPDSECETIQSVQRSAEAVLTHPSISQIDASSPS